MGNRYVKRDELRDTSPQSLYKLNNMLRALYDAVFTQSGAVPAGEKNENIAVDSTQE